MTRLKYMPGHWGMHGFNRHPKLRNVNVSINLLQVSQMAEGDSINLTELGYDKILGSGRMDRALNITVGSASARAIEKVEAAGGSVNLSDSDDEDWEEWEEE
jgi:large subunit ribosomal protein L15